MTRNQYTFAFTAELQNDIHQIASSHRISARQWLIQEQHLWIMHQRLS
jgi:hypothetical protein